MKELKKKKGKKEKVIFRPYSDVIPINEVKKRLKLNAVSKRQPSVLLKSQFNILDEFIYKTDLFYLNSMIWLKRHSHTLWFMIVILFIMSSVMWLIGNLWQF